MRQFGLIGYPLTHSFSKKYFTEKFVREGITDCVYELYPIASIDQFRSLLAEHPALEGLNVTIPYKQQVLSLLDDTSNLPAGLQACNCIKIVQGKTIGYNTDVTGFKLSLQPLLQPHHSSALILGNGGAAEAVKFALKQLNIPYKIVGRRRGEGIDYTYQDLAPAIIQHTPLIINTTPLGTHPDVDECPAIPYEAITTNHYLFDLVYNPAKTLFLQKGEAQGATIKNGQDMLALQAEEGWKIWNQ